MNITTELGYTGFVRSATLIGPDGSASGHDTWVNVDAHDIDAFDRMLGNRCTAASRSRSRWMMLKNVGPQLYLYVASIDTVSDPGFIYDIAPNNGIDDLVPARDPYRH